MSKQEINDDLHENLTKMFNHRRAEKIPLMAGYDLSELETIDDINDFFYHINYGPDQNWKKLDILTIRECNLSLISSEDIDNFKHHRVNSIRLISDKNNEIKWFLYRCIENKLWICSLINIPHKTSVIFKQYTRLQIRAKLCKAQISPDIFSIERIYEIDNDPEMPPKKKATLKDIRRSDINSSEKSEDFFE